MSRDPRRLSAVDPPEPEPDPGLDAGSYRQRSSWPVTRLPAAGMTLLLSLAIVAPPLLANLGLDVWPALLLPALPAMLAARLVFESVDGAFGMARLPLHLLAAAAGAVVGVAVMSSAVLVLGMRMTLLSDLLALGLATPTLAAAALVRDVEIRLRLALRRVFFVGADDRLRELRHELTRTHEARLVGWTPASPALCAEALAEAVRESRATALVLDREAAQAPQVVAAAAVLVRKALPVRDLLSYYESEFKKVPLTELTPAWFLFERTGREERRLSSTLRRALVMLTAAILLLVAALPIALLMLAIRLTSPGPAIFRQVRVGKDGAHFTLLKLRTMTVSEDLGEWATDQDHRITPLGRVLRRYRLDELPQLWNVLRGELALVGPRPEQVPIVERLERQIPFYAARHTIRPGLTGWAQVNLGYSGSLEGARAKLQRDLYYVKHRGLRLDLLILWLTLKAIVTSPR